MVCSNGASKDEESVVSMKFWQALMWMEPEHLVPCAQFAEELGFDGVFIADHAVYPQTVHSIYPASPDGVAPMRPHWPYPDCWSAIGVMMGATKTLNFSVSVYVLPVRSPLEVAKATGTLAILSNNRFRLGIGVGWMKEEFDIYGVDFHTRGKRTDEMIEVMRKIWRGGMVEHHGRFFDFPPLQISPAPSQQIPIWVGGSSPAGLKRAAYLGDGWLGDTTTTDVPGLVHQLDRLRKEAGRDHLPFEYNIPLLESPSLDLFKRLRDAGATLGNSMPFMMELGLTSTLDQKKRSMERFAKEIIHKMDS
jgi:probable F420-dependent oxidoreductase